MDHQHLIGVVLAFAIPTSTPPRLCTWWGHLLLTLLATMARPKRPRRRVSRIALETPSSAED